MGYECQKKFSARPLIRRLVTTICLVIAFLLSTLGPALAARQQFTVYESSEN